MHVLKLPIVIVLVLSIASPAYPTGIPVIDGANLAQQLIHYITMIVEYATQVEQYAVQASHYQTQVSQLENDYRNMVNLDYQSDLKSLEEMQRIMNAAVGISSDTSRMQTQFETLYPDFATYQNQGGASYAQQAAEWARQNQNSALDTLRVQAAIRANIETDSEGLKTLSGTSARASGTKDLLQVANQLSIMQTKQLMQLQQLLVATAKADAAYMAEKASKEAAAAARTKRAKERWKTEGSWRVNPELDKLR